VKPDTAIWRSDARSSYIPEGGRMAPLTRPELINRLVREFLDTGDA
jgi:hypothetical protein